VDFDIEVRLDDDAFDEQAYQTLACLEVGAAKAVFDLANKVRQVASYRSPYLVVVKSHLRLLE
jgi:hypothetical protein